MREVLGSRPEAAPPTTQGQEGPIGYDDSERRHLWHVQGRHGRELPPADVGRRPSNLWTANVMLMTPRMGRYVLGTAFPPEFRSEAIKQRKKWLPRAVAALNASGRFIAFNRLEWEWPAEEARWWRATQSYFRFYVKDPMLRWPPMSDLPREEPDVDPEGIF